MLAIIIFHHTQTHTRTGLLEWEEFYLFKLKIVTKKKPH
jgi:hypothetical protein